MTNGMYGQDNPLREKREVPDHNGRDTTGTISPKLPTACMMGVSRKLDWEKAGLPMYGVYWINLRVADDIVLFSVPGEHLHKILPDLQSEGLAVVLKINGNKLEVMLNKRAVSIIFTQSSEMQEQLEEYNYAEQDVNADPKSNK